MCIGVWWHLYLEGVGGLAQLFDDGGQSLWVDSLLAETHADGQGFHIEARVQQPGDLQ